MTFTIARGVDLAELREALKLRPMAEFDRRCDLSSNHQVIRFALSPLRGIARTR